MTERPDALRQRVCREHEEIDPDVPAQTLAAFPREAKAVGEVLSALGSQRRPSAVKAVGDCLTNDDATVRRGAALALRVCFGTHPETGTRVADDLCRALSDEDHVVKKHAGMALREISAEEPHIASVSVNSLPELLNPESPDLLSVALDIASIVAEAEPDAAVSLLWPLFDTLEAIADRKSSSTGVSEVDSEPSDAAREYQRQYETELIRQRSRIASIIKMILAERPANATSVRTLLRDAINHQGVGPDRAVLAEALGHVAESELEAVTPVIDDLAALLDERDPTVTASVAWALGIIADTKGRQVAEATATRIDPLVGLLDAEPAGSRIASATLLSYIAEHRPGAVDEAGDALIMALDDQNPDVRAGVALALGSARTQEAIPRLRELIDDDPDERVRMTASKAIERIETDNCSGVTTQ